MSILLTWSQNIVLFFSRTQGFHTNCWTTCGPLYMRGEPLGLLQSNDGLSSSWGFPLQNSFRSELLCFLYFISSCPSLLPSEFTAINMSLPKKITCAVSRWPKMWHRAWDQKFNCWILHKNSIVHNYILNQKKYRLNGRWCLFCSLFISKNKAIQENVKTSRTSILNIL